MEIWYTLSNITDLAQSIFSPDFSIIIKGIFAEVPPLWKKPFIKITKEVFTRAFLFKHATAVYNKPNRRCRKTIYSMTKNRKSLDQVDEGIPL